MPGMTDLPDPDDLYGLMNTNSDMSFGEEEFDSSEAVTPDEFRNGSKSAKLTLAPTPTENVKSPRTIAAGYDKKNFILTIQFRDHTLYNYYDVPPRIWGELVSQDSIGKYMQKELDTWPIENRGKAAASGSAYYERKAKKSRKEQTEQEGLNNPANWWL